MRLNIHHETRYTYQEPVFYALQQLRLTPKSRPGHDVISWQTDIKGGQIQVSFDDQHNNQVDLVSFDQGATEVVITNHGVVDTTDTQGVIGAHGGFMPLWCFSRPTARTKVGPNIRALIRALKDDAVGDAIPRLHALSRLIVENVTYKAGQTNSETTAEEALENGLGVCQDHAHIFIAAARQLGFPARYVSGYLMLDDRVDQDATHAWAEAHVDGLGWIGFDVSNQISPDERYVRIATGLDYHDASPVSGMRFGVGVEELVVNLQVQQ